VVSPKIPRVHIFSEYWRNQLCLTPKKGVEKVRLNTVMSRPLCSCGLRPAAINYKKEGRTYFRKKCEICLRHGGVAYGFPKWYLDGYKQKDQCEKCGYKSKHKEQFNVFHVDGNQNNTRPNNLKTICANCQRVLHKEGVRWRQGDLVPDL
jgi:hypothetical protein